MQAQKSKPIDPWAALDAIYKEATEPTGAEWFTVDSYAEHAGMSYPGARHRVQKWLRSGKLDKWTGHSAAHGRRLSKYRVKA